MVWRRIGGVDAKGLYCVDRLQDALDLRPPADAQQDFATGTDERQRLVCVALRNGANDVNAGDDRAEVVRGPAHEREDVAGKESEMAAPPIDNGLAAVMELVVVRPPPTLAQFLAERRYLPEGVPMLKRVLALPGQTVCRSDRTITVDGIAMGDALERDTSDRPLPVWQGCKRISDGQVFLMNWQSEDSFDGRYFGLLSRATILGRADPVWTQEED
jgi:type IV secretory pathway protease TraF